MRKSNKTIGLRRDDLYDVDMAEFFFDFYLENRVFVANNIEGGVGVVVSAYGDFLAYCRVHFKDGSPPVDINQFVRVPEED